MWHEYLIPSFLKRIILEAFEKAFLKKLKTHNLFKNSVHLNYLCILTHGNGILNLNLFVYFYTERK